MQFSPRGLGPSPQELPLHAPQVTEARIGSLRPRAGVAASASEAAGGEFEGGWEHWSGGGKLRHSVRGRAPQGSAFGCPPGTPPGSLRERPESFRERGPARSARFFWERWERAACFFSGAHGPLPSLQLSLALSLSLESLSPESSVQVRRALLRIKEHQGARATRGQ